ncbi:hypothetical protein [Bacillus sp. JJ722]|uniref:hypothetical protein n=1 Tax=Bacillus sp. JJ722 TaxID=3122973 RepID=UPI0030002A5E
MKKTLGITAIISFVISFVLFLFLIDNSTTTIDADGFYSAEEMNNRDYFFMISSYSIVITAIIVLGVYLFSAIKKKQKNK